MKGLITFKDKSRPAKKSAAKKNPAKKIKMKAKAGKTASKMSAAQTAKKPASAKAGKMMGTTADWNRLFTPLDDRVLVQLENHERKTAGGLFLPDTAEERPMQGKVVRVGRGHRDKKGRLRPLDVQLGDRVLFSQFAGTKCDIMGNPVLILREEEILGIYRD